MNKKDSICLTDKFLEFSDWDILQNSCKIRAKITKDYAQSKFDKYIVIQDLMFVSDFDKEIKDIEKQITGRLRG